MLALTTTDALTLLDAPTLKHPPSSVSSCQSLIHRPTASTWSPDNTSLFLASSSNVHKYDSLANSLHCIYSTSGSEQISHLVSKDKGNALIFTIAQVAQVLECGSGSISQTFDSHKSPITSLSLSNDGTLLASSSPNAVHVHNLTLGSHTVLRGLPAAGARINTCVFHAHMRTRLLLGAGRQLLVYDTTRPSGPAKTVAMSEGTMGQIASVACSPFSKTLVAFATDAGSVSLVDLDRDKALFRTINVKVALTCIAFSPEGAAIYLGTENGKLLILDLRALDKPPKTIVVSEHGSRVETISVQKKVKMVVEQPSSRSSTTVPIPTKSSTQPDPSRRPPSAAAPPKTQPAKPVAKPILKADKGASPVQTRARAESKTIPTTSPKSPPLISGAGKGSDSPRAKAGVAVPKKNILSPARDPLGNGRSSQVSVRVKSPGPTVGGHNVVPRTKTSVSPKVPTSVPRSSTLGVPAAQSRSRSGSATSRIMATSESRRPASAISSSSALSGTMDDTRPASSISRAASPFPPLLVGSQKKQCEKANPTSGSTGADAIQREGGSRTPSPDLPNVDANTETLPSVNAGRRNRDGGSSALVLDTPEVDCWIAAGKRDGSRAKELRKGKEREKTVGSLEAGGVRVKSQRKGVEKEGQTGRHLAMQVSPRQATASLASSPLRHSTVIDASLPPVSPAHDILRTIVRDVMYEFRRETHAEMVGLHLDLVRMGRGWRRELRGMMEEHVGDLRDLREENGRLREENARLRRGY